MKSLLVFFNHFVLIKFTSTIISVVLILSSPSILVSDGQLNVRSILGLIEISWSMFLANGKGNDSIKIA